MTAIEIVEKIHNKELSIREWRSIDKLKPEKFSKFRNIDQLYRHYILKEDQTCPYCNRVLDYNKKTKETRSCYCGTDKDKQFQDIVSLNDQDFYTYFKKYNFYRSFLKTSKYSVEEIHNEFYSRFSEALKYKSIDEYMYCLENPSAVIDPDSEFINLRLGYKQEMKPIIDLINSDDVLDIIKAFKNRYSNVGLARASEVQEFLRDFPGFSTLEKIYRIENPNFNNKCLYCSKETSFISQENKYASLCSHACVNKYYAKENQATYKKNFVNTKLVQKLKDYNVSLNEEYKTNSEEHNFTCLKCKSTFKSNFNNTVTCRICTPKMSGESKQEIELYNYIRNLLGESIEVIRNDRHLGKELDIYIPSMKLAIEYNGLYWHSSKFREKDYHLNKTKLCENNGIQLIHIFSDEFLEKRPVIESMLKYRLGLVNIDVKDNKDCYIKEMPSLFKGDT